YIAKDVGGTYLKHSGVRAGHSTGENVTVVIGFYKPLTDLYNHLRENSIIIFAGQDFIQATEVAKEQLRERVLQLLSRGVKFAIEGEEIRQRALDTFGLSDVSLLPIPSEYEKTFPESPPPFPKEFNVGCYLPHYRWDHYNGPLIVKVAKACPNYKFHFYSYRGYD